MATCFSGVGNTPVENLKTQDVENISEDESQDEDLIRQLLCETAHLKQFVEGRDNEPREAIHDLEQRLNELTLTLCCQDTPIENVLDRYTETLCTKEDISGEFFITRYTHIKWARLFTASGLVSRYRNGLRINWQK